MHLKTLLLAIFIVLTCAFAQNAAAQGLEKPEVCAWTGTWNASAWGGSVKAPIISSVNGKLKGSLELTGLRHEVNGPLTGTIKDNEVTLTRWPLPYGTLEFYLTLSNDKMTGRFLYGTMWHNVDLTCVR